ncbi:hypothetical protein [Streptomyces sp. HPF1205]|uniref:hypothetical protein n=1 Tax=Streptomyces sp. HPF1205 TaxID=2873262 RepID=UPI001CEDCDF4|nr:hypothetical protein [Streptomyces sp. HPF1205]
MDVGTGPGPEPGPAPDPDPEADSGAGADVEVDQGADAALAAGADAAQAAGADPRWPAPDASVLPYGERVAVATLALYGTLFVVTAGPAARFALLARGYPVVWAFSGLFGAAALVFLAACLRGLRLRHLKLALDATGVWVLDRGRTAVIPWASLGAAGLYWTEKQGREALLSLELCPLEPVDHPDPLLRNFVRDATPEAPCLPRMRYRIQARPVRRGFQETCEHWCPPDLWFGRQLQPSTYDTERPPAPPPTVHATPTPPEPR